MEFQQQLDLQLFPNPASTYLNLSFEAPASTEVSGNVFNALGQLQYQFPVEKAMPSGVDWQLQVSDWPAGLYYLQLKIGSEIVSRSFVVDRGR